MEVRFPPCFAFPTENAMNEFARIAQENMQRAKAYLQKGEYIKSLEAACEGVQLTMDKRVFGQDKITVQTLVSQYLLELSRKDEIKEFYYARRVFSAEHLTKYRPGKEKKCLENLLEIRDGMGLDQEVKAEQEEMAREESIKDTLAEGMSLLKEGNAPKGKVILRKLAESQAAEPKVTNMIAKAFYRHGLLVECVDICELAIKANPGNPKSYSIAINALLKARDFTRAEKMFLAAAKRFGVHPKTQLRMAGMYMEWRKWSEAYDKAKDAVTGDPSLKEEAREILDVCGRRIFGRSGASSPGGGSGGGGGRKGGPIIL